MRPIGRIDESDSHIIWHNLLTVARIRKLPPLYKVRYLCVSLREVLSVNSIMSRENAGKHRQ